MRYLTERILDLSPPTPDIVINDIPYQNLHPTSPTGPVSLADCMNIFNMERSAIREAVVVRNIRSALIGTQLRQYVSRRTSESTSRSRAPRNMMPELGRRFECTEFTIKKHMLWSRIAGLMPSLVVNGNNLFDWIFASNSAVRYQCHENAILERTIAAASNQSIQIQTNLRLNRLLDIDSTDNGEVDNGNEEDGGIAGGMHSLSSSQAFIHHPSIYCGSGHHLSFRLKPLKCPEVKI